MLARDIILEDDPLWYKDAVVYELHVKTFFDSNDDGIGDFRGLIRKLDYLKNLGVTAIWLLPFYPSPLKDDGYDISDHYNVHPDYGTLNDFKEFLRQAHRRGMRVITELVLNHTSDQHPWFEKSRRAKPGSEWRDFYVWSETPDKFKQARVIFQDFESSNWTYDPAAKAYFWHRFYHHQPDLNYDNPKVQQAVMEVIDFWFELGVDGMRLDAVPYLYEREGTNCENLPETHEFLKKLRKHVDEKFKNRMLLAEANQWSEDAAAYFGRGDECQMAFNFPVMPRMFLSIQMEDRFPVVDILDPPINIPDACQWALFLRNHDELTLEMVTDEERDYMYRIYATDPRAKINLGIRRRLAPLLGNNRRKTELMNTILFSLPGTPVVYYGDELGMGDNYYLGDRNGVRTPMQWSPDLNAGFSKANPQKLYLPVIIDPEYHFESLNVANQEKNLSSPLWWLKRVIAMRKKFRAFSRGSLQFLSPQNPKVLAFIRRHEDEIMLAVFNLSRFSQVVELDLSTFAGYVPEEVFSQNEFPAVKDVPYLLTLGPYNHYWFQLKKEPVHLTEAKERSIFHLSVRDLKEIMSGTNRERLESEFARYLPTCRWFGGKGRLVRKTSLVEAVPLNGAEAPAMLFLLEVSYREGTPETYNLPVVYLARERSQILEQQYPQGLIAYLKVGEEEGVLFDGVYCDWFQCLLFEMISKRKKIRGGEGEFIAHHSRRFKSLLAGKELPLSSAVMKGEQSNNSIVYGSAFILKLFRRLDRGINPDVEVVRALSEKISFSQIPEFAGAIEYRGKNGPPISIGLMQAFVPNEGEAWTYTLDNIGHYYERVLAKKDEIKDPAGIKAAGGEALMNELVGSFFAEMIGLLGKRTAELHLALASITDEPDFAPEPFTTLYQRSLFQSMRSMTKQNFSLLQGNLRRLPEEIRPEAEAVLGSENEVIERLGRILGRPIPAGKIRVHGDYHLGQVLFTGKDFVIIDFEGEPARPLSERRLKRSPLYDAAGMIRSFHYAAHAGLLKHPSVRPEDKAFLEPWVRAWYDHVSDLFLKAYLATVGTAAFIPQDEGEFRTLFKSFLLEKAVYELGYELNNRPDWAIIPLKGLSYILGQKA